MRAVRCCLLALLAGAWAATAGAVEVVDFERHVAAILVRHCAKCHNGSDPAGGLNLTSRDAAFSGGESKLPAIVPNRPETSQLLARLRAGEMPPEGQGQRVAAADVARLEAWIAAGAAWPRERVLNPFEFTTLERAGRDWWSLARPARPEVPAVRHADRVRTPIDAFVLAKLEEHGLDPAPEADRATFIRRATFDLHGLPPSPQEIQAFVDDPAADAYERLIDGLLASPRYGERWARHWLDVVRFGESNGYETNTARRDAWPYRDWVIGAFNEDLPYPRFVFEQLAGDQVGVDAATGYLVGGAHDVVSSPDVELTLQQRMNDLDDMVSTTATAFLGLSAGCAKCHDHKFDPIAQRDYYALQAVFAGVQHGARELRSEDSQRRRQQAAELQQKLDDLERRTRESLARHQPLARLDDSPAGDVRPAVNAAWNVDRFVPTRARFLRFTILATNQGEPCLDEIEIFAAGDKSGNVALASAGAKATSSSVFAGGGSNLHQLNHINDGRYGNGHSWISAEPGGGWAQIEWPEATTIERVVWARDREGAFRDRLPTRYTIATSENGADWQLVANSDDRKVFDPQAKSPESPATEGLPADVSEQIEHDRGEAQALRKKLAELAPAEVYAGTFKQPQATHLLYRGEPLQPREEVAPGAIAAVGSPLVLAADAPEAERRVALARWIAGAGNPLAARVMVNRIWHHHFGQGLVKTPSDFGFHGGQPSHPELLDWLATRFIAEGWRPKALHRVIMLSSTYRQSSTVSSAAAAKDSDGRLLWRFAPRRLEAEAIRDAVLATSGALDLRMGGPGYDVFEPNTSYVKIYIPKQSFGPAEWRRMVYQNKPRMRHDATFGEFDCPDSSQTLARRNVSTTALQALNLANGPFMIQQADLFAERLQREGGDEPSSQIDRAFRLAFGRAPADDESAAAQVLVRQHGLVAFCRALFNANEFLYVR